MEFISVNNRAEKCLRDWRPDHERYFHKKEMVITTYAEALDSFVSYLRHKELTYAEASIEIETEGNRWFYLSLYLSIVASFFLNIFFILINNKVDTTSSIKVWPVLFLIGQTILCILVPALIIRQESHSVAISERKFLQIALRRYLELYGNELGVKTVETKRGAFVNVPLAAESIYSAKMRLSIHYKHIFVIAIKDTHRTYQYIWYTDSNYSNMNEHTKRVFVDLCKQQTGRDWNSAPTQNFSLQQLA